MTRRPTSCCSASTASPGSTRQCNAPSEMREAVSVRQERRKLGQSDSRTVRQSDCNGSAAARTYPLAETQRPPGREDRNAPALCVLGILARYIVLCLPMTYITGRQRFAQENKISASSNTNPDCRSSFLIHRIRAIRDCCSLPPPWMMRKRNARGGKRKTRAA